MPHNPDKSKEFGHENAVAPARGISEVNAIPKSDALDGTSAEVIRAAANFISALSRHRHFKREAGARAP